MRAKKARKWIETRREILGLHASRHDSPVTMDYVCLVWRVFESKDGEYPTRVEYGRPVYDTPVGDAEHSLHPNIMCASFDLMHHAVCVCIKEEETHK